MTVFIFMLPSMAVLYAIVYAFLEYYKQESTSQPSSQSSYQFNPTLEGEAFRPLKSHFL